MLSAIREFFDQRLQPSAPADEGPDPVVLASAALMFEVMRADRSVDDAERETIRRLLVARFELPPEDLDTLETLAAAEVDEAHDLFQFTALINEHYGQPERIEMVRNMWAVAWADGNVDRFEEHIIRRVADLLHVRHRDFIAAKLAARPEA